MATVDITDLKDLNSTDKLRKIFQNLNYDYVNSQLSTRNWRQEITQHIVDNDIKLLSQHKDFHIVYCKIEPFRLGIERPIINQLLQEHPKLLVVFSDKSLRNWHFVNIKYDEEVKNRRLFRRIVIGPDERLHTAAERINILEIVNEKISSLELQTKHDEAFDVDKVTREFFYEFRDIFEKTKQEFEKTNKSICLKLRDIYEDQEYREQINKFAFIFLGRIIFLYFLQRKGWIEDNRNYILEFVKNEQNHGLYQNLFQPLFFDVFAKKENDRPPEIRERFKTTPYLNGGLFERSQLEEENPTIAFVDSFISNIILRFFEVYNFTVDENTPFDQAVSIDPEMLGKIFENALAEEERGKKGTFYTPREIVHYMVKQSLFQFLRNETNIDPKKLRDFVFEEDFDLNSFSKEEIRLIDEELDEIKVLDPAVGSGAFPVEVMQILVNLRRELDVKVGKNRSEIELKKTFIKNNLYGVDIDPSAIEIAKLRLWLSLVVDYEKNEVEPLPNLDFQFRLGNSLQEKIGDLDIFRADTSGKLNLGWAEGFEKIKQEMLNIKDEFYSCEDEEEKRRLKKEFDSKEHLIILEKIKDLEKQWKNESVKGAMANKKAASLSKEIDQLKQKVKEGTYKLFKPDFHFSEVFDRKDKEGQRVNGFDIVIGNPPYGVKVEEDIKDWHGLGSKDSYGVFISTAFKRFLKLGGILSFIVSDTWLTIKTHKQLREQVLAKQLHKIIRLHQDCFEATVNACIMSLTNYTDDNSNLIAADLTNISTRKEIIELREKLYHIENFIGQSTPKFAVYQYNQDLIKTNSNLPIFVGSPKLFRLMNDTGNNAKSLPLANYNDEICGGIKSYDNKKYIKSIDGTDNYPQVENKLIVKRELSETEKLNGIKICDESTPFYLQFEKGGETIKDNSCFNNYYYPARFFFPWDEKTVRELTPLNALRNRHRYFSEGIGVTAAGVYSPLFRYAKLQLFQNGFQVIFLKEGVDKDLILGILCSKLIRYVFNVFINHSVNSNAQDVELIPIVSSVNKCLTEKVREIISKLMANPEYNYYTEQGEVDKLVYEMYGLNEDDIQEVETWYARRYPKLARFANIK